MKFTLEIQENKETGDYFIELPDELIKDLGWSVGDTVKWIDNKDGSWTLEKK